MAAKILLGHQFIQALLDAGVISAEENATRVVIDATANEVVKLYVERAGDESLIEVAVKASLDITNQESTE